MNIDIQNISNFDEFEEKQKVRKKQNSKHICEIPEINAHLSIISS